MSDQYTVDNIKDRYLAMTDEIERLRKENEQLRDAYDTEALLISYNLGYACGKDITKDEIERLRGLLREAHVKMVENDLWVNLRQRVAAALGETDG